MIVLKCNNYKMFLSACALLKYQGYNIKRDKKRLLIYLTK